jgi:hypothetical protein
MLRTPPPPPPPPPPPLPPPGGPPAPCPPSTRLYRRSPARWRPRTRELSAALRSTGPSRAPRPAAARAPLPAPRASTPPPRRPRRPGRAAATVTRFAGPLPPHRALRGAAAIAGRDPAPHGLRASSAPRSCPEACAGRAASAVPPPPLARWPPSPSRSAPSPRPPRLRPRPCRARRLPSTRARADSTPPRATARRRGVPVWLFLFTTWPRPGAASLCPSLSRVGAGSGARAGALRVALRLGSPAVASAKPPPSAAAGAHARRARRARGRGRPRDPRAIAPAELHAGQSVASRAGTRRQQAELTVLGERLKAEPALVTGRDARRTAGLRPRSRHHRRRAGAHAAQERPNHHDHLYEIWTGVPGRTPATLPRRAPAAHKACARRLPALAVALELREVEDCAGAERLVARASESAIGAPSAGCSASC